MQLEILRYEEAFALEALRGMRHPLESYHRADSFEERDLSGEVTTTIGENDLDLAHRLIDGGSEHRKFMRQIPVIMEICAPLYW